tara:strand:+ start:1192 stop:1332 length:141 start_codon:yes stop_codon:yes gene_type:complete
LKDLLDVIAMEMEKAGCSHSTTKDVVLKIAAYLDKNPFKLEFKDKE